MSSTLGSLILRCVETSTLVLVLALILALIASLPRFGPLMLDAVMVLGKLFNLHKSTKLISLPCKRTV